MSLGIVLVSTIIIVIALCLSINETSGNVLIERDTSSTLKGFAILLVFIHHFGQLASPQYYNHSFLGYIGVTIFLFIAGYVTQKQAFLKGKEYLGGRFLVKKACRLYIPYLIIILAFSLVYRHSLSELVSKIIHIEADWFLTVITIFYFMFWLSGMVAHKLTDGGVLPCMAVAVVVYLFVCLILGMESVWYNTALAFPIGMVGYELERKKKKINNKLIMAAITVLCLCFIILSITRIWSYVFASMAASVLLSVLVILVFEGKELNSRALNWLGGLSWEFYLCQSKILSKMLEWFNDKPVIWFFGAFICSLIVAYLVHKFIEVAGTIIRKIITPRQAG